MSRSTSADAIISEYATKPLDFEPGTRWSYSNTGYTLVGRVLERVGGKPLGVMLQERIFTPLGMRQTAFDPSFTERVAKGYSSWALNEHEVAAPEGSGWTGAAGAIWSNANDLARWDLALMRPGFLTPASREILFRERILRNGVPTGYAAGLSVSRDAGRTIISHGGATSGFSATNMFVPQDTAAVVVLSNYDENVTAGALLPLVSPRRVDNDAQPARPTQTPVPPPTPKGPPALQAALDFFTALQRGSVNRSGLTPDYAAFLTPKKVAQASKSLSSLGEPTNAVLLGVRERGGMQVAGVRLTFPNRVVRISMYRAPSGAMEQFLLW